MTKYSKLIWKSDSLRFSSVAHYMHEAGLSYEHIAKTLNMVVPRVKYLCGRYKKDYAVWVKICELYE